jgi:anti-sigma-K factor RskA
MMDEQGHDQDLVAAYVLGAVDASEAAQVAEHLATCAECRRLESELRDVEAVLPALAGERTPPPALKAHLMAVIEAEARGETTGPISGPAPAPGVRQPQPQPPDGAAPPAVEPLPLRPRAPYRAWRVGPLLAVAAVIALVAIGIAAWRLLAPGQVQPPRQYAMRGTAAEPSIRGTLTYYPDGRRLDLDLHGLRRLPPHRVYELWLIRTHGTSAVKGITVFRPTANGTAHLTLTGQNVPAYNLAGLTVERSFALKPTLPIGATATLG